MPAAQLSLTVRAALPGAWLILPTYNEAENIAAMLRAALAQLASTGREHTILVVDDGSPDGTGQIADAMAGEHPEIRVMHRPAKQGLGFLGGSKAYLLKLASKVRSGIAIITCQQQAANVYLACRRCVRGLAIEETAEYLVDLSRRRSIVIHERYGIGVT